MHCYLLPLQFDSPFLWLHLGRISVFDQLISYFEMISAFVANVTLMLLPKKGGFHFVPRPNDLATF